MNLRNKRFAIGLLSLGILCLGFFKIHPESEKLTLKQEIKLETAVEDIREEREFFDKLLNTYTKDKDAFAESVDNQKKSVDIYKKARSAKNKASSAYKKSSDAYTKARNAKNKAYDVYAKYSASYSNNQDAYTKAWEAYTKAWDAYIKAYEKYIMSMGRFFSAQKEYHESQQIFLDFSKKLLSTYRNFNESKKESWTKLNTLFEVISISLETSTHVLNLEEQKEFVKDCFTMSKKLNVKSQSMQSNFNGIDNKIILSDTYVFDINELLKGVKETFDLYVKAWGTYTKALDIQDKSWDVYVKAWDNYTKSSDAQDKSFDSQNNNTAEDLYAKSSDAQNKASDAQNKAGDISKNSEIYDKAVDIYKKKYDESAVLYDLWKERKRVEKLEDILKEGLLRDTNKTFHYAIQFVGKEPRATNVYQQALKAYEEIEKFRELLGAVKSRNL